MNFVNLSPIDIPKKTKDNVLFDPLKLGIYCPEKRIMTEAVAKILKKLLIDQIRIL